MAQSLGSPFQPLGGESRVGNLFVIRQSALDVLLTGLKTERTLQLTGETTGH